MKKGKFFVTDLIAVVLSVVTAIVYATAVARENSPIIIGALAAAAIVGAVLLVKKVPYVEYVPFVLDLVGVGIFTKLAFDEVGDVLSNINMNGLSASWIASAVLLVLTAVCAGIATVFAGSKR